MLLGASSGQGCGRDGRKQQPAGRNRGAAALRGFPAPSRAPRLLGGTLPFALPRTAGTRNCVTPHGRAAAIARYVTPSRRAAVCAARASPPPPARPQHGRAGAAAAAGSGAAHCRDPLVRRGPRPGGPPLLVPGGGASPQARGAGAAVPGPQAQRHPRPAGRRAPALLGEVRARSGLGAGGRSQPARGLTPASQLAVPSQLTVPPLLLSASRACRWPTTTSRWWASSGTFTTTRGSST